MTELSRMRAALRDIAEAEPIPDVVAAFEWCREVALAALTPSALSGDAGEVWQPIDSAPKDGTEIQARIPGNGEDNVIAWVDDLIDNNGNYCGGWAFTREQEPPDCWTDGYCWMVNEDGDQSVQPTHWKALPSHQGAGE